MKEQLLGCFDDIHAIHYRRAVRFNQIEHFNAVVFVDNADNLEKEEIGETGFP